MPKPSLLRVLASSFVAGEQTVDELVLRGRHALGRPWPWLRPLAQRYLDRLAGRTRPRQQTVVQFFLQDAAFQRVWAKHGEKLSVAHWLTDASRMQPVPAALAWDLPAIESAGALGAWLTISTDELEWFADLKGLGCKLSPQKLRHYTYRILPKLYGTVRLIEAPKTRLKKLQRQVLTGILNRVPVHPAAHGFVKTRSIKSFVAPHTGQGIVLRMDLQNFFPSFSRARIQAFFRTAGYPESVSDLLGGICTSVVPPQVWRQTSSEIDARQLQEARLLYSRPHLPQGAPTSPALANICTYRADCRLTGIARSAGAEYTRYADDIAFSGSVDFERCVERFSTHVAAILMEEGFAVNHRKTRIMRQGVRQHLAGLVANQRVNVIRSDFDRLKATLTNCLRFGPESQNRDGHPSFRAHLEGRLAFVEMVNAGKGKRLRAIFDRIQWKE